MEPKILRITTVPISMNILLKGQLEFMNRHFEVHGATSYDEKHFNEVAQREGIKMHAIEMKRTISPLHDLGALWKLYRLISKIKPQIVHTHTPKAGLLGMLAAKMAGVPIRLHTVAGLPLVETTGARRRLLENIERLTYSCAHKIYPNSTGLQRIILENKFCSAEKIKVIGDGSSNGINTKHFTPTLSGAEKSALRENLSLRSDDIVFCFVGRLCIEKGIRELIAAFLNLLEQRPNSNAKLLLVGPLEKENGVLGPDTLKKMNETPEILSVGRHDDIRPYLEISDIFVFPSYREGFPNVVLQAGAMGLPCIVSDINGSNEIIIPDLNGMIVPVKDTVRLANAMTELLLNKELRDRFAGASRPNIIKKYEQQSVWEALLEEYQLQLQNINV